MIKLLKCMRCGNIVEVIHDSTVPPFCCGQPMTVLEPNTTDGAFEKHVPAVEVNGNVVTVKVGSVEHPMLEAHYITHIFLETSTGVQRCALKPGEKPEAVFILPEGVTPLCAYEYCNLHGFWAKEL